jgi:hypothetical protein
MNCNTLLTHSEPLHAEMAIQARFKFILNEYEINILISSMYMYIHALSKKLGLFAKKCCR